jgi:hypothetical protein
VREEDYTEWNEGWERGMANAAARVKDALRGYNAESLVHEGLNEVLKEVARWRELLVDLQEMFHAYSWAMGDEEVVSMEERLNKVLE